MAGHAVGIRFSDNAEKRTMRHDSAIGTVSGTAMAPLARWNIPGLCGSLATAGPPAVGYDTKLGISCRNVICSTPFLGF